jgi:hypothetical protein
MGDAGRPAGGPLSHSLPPARAASGVKCGRATNQVSENEKARGDKIKE